MHSPLKFPGAAIGAIRPSRNFMGSIPRSLRRTHTYSWHTQAVSGSGGSGPPQYDTPWPGRKLSKKPPVVGSFWLEGKARAKAISLRDAEAAENKGLILWL